MVASGFSSNHRLTRSLCSYTVCISGIVRSYLNTSRSRIAVLFAANRAGHLFAALARSFGAEGTRIDAVEQLGGALCEAFAAGRPALIECPMDRPPSPFQMRCGGGQGSPEPIVEFFYE